ncbi:prolipoprotein diacylglyceryl transferase [Cytophagaceae bacterium ABcell3]|nr:prolipoprotein diacylglyceryl transferase [Cytophagaceae bacterium ABcell3]
MLNFILWEVSPELFPDGWLPIRWYGLLFATGFLLGQQILIRIYKGEGKSEKHVETLTVYMVIATVIGARLGHCLFYEPDHYLRNPIDILKIWEGGLASHGAALGILIAIWLYSRREVGQSYFYVLDRLVIVIALAGALIRTGNLMNHEIIGRETDVPWAFIFTEEPKNTILAVAQEGRPNSRWTASAIDLDFRHRDTTSHHHDILLAGLEMDIQFNRQVSDEELPQLLNQDLRRVFYDYTSVREHLVFPLTEVQYTARETEHGTLVTLNIFGIPRHPAQLYEALSSFILFLALLWMYSRKKGKTPEGRLLGLFIIVIFSLRFLYEFFKEAQVPFEEDMMFNMGQILSIPLVIIGLFIFLRSFRKKNEIN